MMVSSGRRAREILLAQQHRLGGVARQDRAALGYAAARAEELPPDEVLNSYFSLSMSVVNDSNKRSPGARTR